MRHSPNRSRGRTTPAQCNVTEADLRSRAIDSAYVAIAPSLPAVSQRQKPCARCTPSRVGLPKGVTLLVEKSHSVCRRYRPDQPPEIHENSCFAPNSPIASHPGQSQFVPTPSLPIAPTVCRLILLTKPRHPGQDVPPPPLRNSVAQPDDRQLIVI